VPRKGRKATPASPSRTPFSTLERAGPQAQMLVAQPFPLLHLPLSLPGFGKGHKTPHLAVVNNHALATRTAKSVIGAVTLASLAVSNARQGSGEKCLLPSFDPLALPVSALSPSGRLGHEAAYEENGCWPYQPIHPRSRADCRNQIVRG